MSRRWPTGRTHEEEPPASRDVSRLLVLGFLIAAILGLATGIGWMGCHLIRSQFGG
jgi:hypothetical protein